MGRLLKKKTESQLQKKKLKMKATQDENTETPSAENVSRTTGSLIVSQAEKVSRDSSTSRSVARPVKKTAVAKGLEFFQEARVELEKVVWPSKPQTIASTGVVIVIVMILSFFLGIADALLRWVVQLALN